MEFPIGVCFYFLLVTLFIHRQTLSSKGVPNFACLARLRGWCVIRIRAFALLLFRGRLSTACFQDLHLTFFAANVVADHDVIKEEW